MSVEIEISKEVYDLLGDLKSDDESINQCISHLIDSYHEKSGDLRKSHKDDGNYSKFMYDDLRRRLREEELNTESSIYKEMYDYYGGIIKILNFEVKDDLLYFSKHLTDIDYLKDYHGDEEFQYYALEKFNAVRLGIEDILKDADFEIDFKKYDDIVFGHWNKIKNNPCASYYLSKYENIRDNLRNLTCLQSLFFQINKNFNFLKKEIPKDDLIDNNVLVEDLEVIENALNNIEDKLYSK